MCQSVACWNACATRSRRASDPCAPANWNAIGRPSAARSCGDRAAWAHARNGDADLCRRALDAAGEAYNIGSGVATSVREVVETFERVLGRRLDAVYDGDHDDSVRWTDITKIGAVTGWRPAIGLEEGLRRLATATVP